MSLAMLARTAAPQEVGGQDGWPRPGAAPLPQEAPAAVAPRPELSRRDGFDSLVKYIPIETVTIFVAVCSARPAVERLAGGFSFGVAYAICAALTPLLLWLIAAGRRRAGGGIGPLGLHWWPAFAATVAFLVWALSVPGVTEMLSADKDKQEAWGMLAGVGAVLVSLLLSLLEPLLGQRPAAV